MIAATLTLPAGTLSLASTERGESPSGLRVTSEDGSRQVVALLRAKEPRQKDRGNRLTLVSFNAQRAFASVTEAESHVLALPGFLLDQTNATAEVTNGETTVNLYEVAVSLDASHFGCRVFYVVSLRGRLNP